MHELSLVSGILDVVEPSVPSKESLRAVRVTIGPFSGVCAESLLFCFGEVARQRGYPNADLEIHAVPARMRCMACGLEYAVRDPEAFCPSCGGMDRVILSGREFTVDSIQIEE